MAGTKESSNLLQEIAQDLDPSEKRESSVNVELARLVNSLMKHKILEEKTQRKVDQYPRPTNIKGL